MGRMEASREGSARATTVARRPLVSVIVPAYNHAGFVGACLGSIRSETYRPLEVLVCDDGSTDGTYSAVERWISHNRDLPVRLLSQANQGITRTLNRLLAEAQGEYVTMVASDDELISGGIAVRLAAIGSGVRAVFGDAEVIDADGRTLHASFIDMHGANRRRLQRDVAAEIILKWAVPGPVLLSETDALRAIGGYSDDLMIEDWDLYLRLAARGWLRFVSAPVARYRISQTNWSGRRRNYRRIDSDLRKSAERNRRLFRGWHRAMIEFQRLFYIPPFLWPVRVISKAWRILDGFYARRYRSAPDPSRPIDPFG